MSACVCKMMQQSKLLCVGQNQCFLQISSHPVYDDPWTWLSLLKKKEWKSQFVAEGELLDNELTQVYQEPAQLWSCTEELL